MKTSKRSPPQLESAVRLFLAVNLPDHIRRDLWKVAEPLRANRYPVKWVVSESLHVTMKFLGEVAPHRVDEITEATTTAAAGAKPFALRISGFGAFPSVQRPRVVWAGCDPAPPLELLQHRVEQELDRIGFPLEGRPFRPHITLGRVRREAKRSDFLAFRGDVESLQYEAEAAVESVDVMESTLTSKGAMYTRRHAVRFEG
jgi:2'-5' RNA ligase